MLKYRKRICVGFSVKNHLKTIQPVPSTLDKPAKDRILESADQVFRIHGLRAGIGVIAHHANSNTETVIKHFGYRARLVSQFVKSLIDLAEQHWREVEQKYSDAEGRLRYWTFCEQVQGDDLHGAERLLARSAAELSLEYPKSELLVEIEQHWQAERRRVVKLCEAAAFREPRELADKLLLLVHGVRNERGVYGYHSPSRLLHQAADDLMVAHGAARKLLLSLDDD
jgi:hypothetical protein